MIVPRRAPRRRAVLFLILFAIVAVMVVATFGEAEGKTLTPRNNNSDKRNKSYGEINGANVANDCWSHHKGEGMRDVFIVYPIMPKQLKIGEPYEIPVQIVNPWKQAVRKMDLEVSLLGDKQVLTVDAAAASAGAKLDKYYANHAVLGTSVNDNFPPGTGLPGTEPTTVTFGLQVPQGVSALTASVELHPSGQPPQAGGAQDEYNVTFRAPQSRTGPAFTPYDPTSLNRTYATPIQVAGLYNITVAHKVGYAARTDVYVNATMVVGSTAAAGAKVYAVKIPVDMTIEKGAPPYTAKVKVTPFATGPQPMEFHVRAELYYQHQLRSTPNNDFYNRYQNLSTTDDFIVGGTITPEREVVVGSSFIPSEFGAVSASAIGGQWQLVLGESAGFGAAALLLPSLLLGGTYGKASRRFFNAILGGAKRRVMFHNLVSLSLSLVAFIHILLFILEIRYTVLMGVMWGGFGALSLLVLGLTGYYQVPLIQRHGYKWWRYTHLAFGLLVIVFVAYHMIADGPDFFFIKQQIPKWINDVNLAQK